MLDISKTENKKWPGSYQHLYEQQNNARMNIYEMSLGQRASQRGAYLYVCVCYAYRSGMHERMKLFCDQVRSGNPFAHFLRRARAIDRFSANLADRKFYFRLSFSLVRPCAPEIIPFIREHMASKIVLARRYCLRQLSEPRADYSFP